MDELLDAMKSDAGIEIEEIRVDGGCSRSDFLMQFQSDLSQCGTVRSAQSEATALGPRSWQGLPWIFGRVRLK